MVLSGGNVHQTARSGKTSSSESGQGDIRSVGSSDARTSRQTLTQGELLEPTRLGKPGRATSLFPSSQVNGDGLRSSLTGVCLLAPLLDLDVRHADRIDHDRVRGPSAKLRSQPRFPGSPEGNRPGLPGPRPRRLAVDLGRDKIRPARWSITSPSIARMPPCLSPPCSAREGR